MEHKVFNYLSGLKSSEQWLLNGKYHRIDGPARLVYNRAGRVVEEYWQKDDKMHRIGAAAMIYYRDDGTKTNEYWYKDGKLHRTDGPAEIAYNEDETMRYVYWYNEGVLHRTDGPAETNYRRGTHRVSEHWYINGEKQRSRKYHLNDKVSEEKWYKNDVLHRIDGPAEIHYRDDGTKDYELWYIDGRRLTDDEIKKHKQKRREALRGRTAAKFRAVKKFTEAGRKPKIGSMVWAETYGRYLDTDRPEQFRTREQCTKAVYLDEDGYTRPYTKDQLYFMAKSMDLPATRRMTKSELCQLIATGARPFAKQSPF